jgi:hypothetical protein
MIEKGAEQSLFLLQDPSYQSVTATGFWLSGRGFNAK